MFYFNHKVKIIENTSKLEMVQDDMYQIVSISHFDLRINQGSEKYLKNGEQPKVEALSTTQVFMNLSQPISADI